MRKFLLCFLVFVSAVVTGFSQEKPTLTVFDFTTTSLTKNEIRSVMSFLTMGFYRTDAFTVIDSGDRDKRLEKARSKPGACTNDACFLNAGKLIAVDYIVIGSIVKKDARFLLAAKFLSVKSGKILRSTDNTYQSMKGMIDDVNSITLKLSQASLDALTETPISTTVPYEIAAEIAETSEEPGATASPTIEPSDPEHMPTAGSDIGPQPGENRTDDIISESPNKNHVAFGAMGSWTIPVGNVGQIMGWTITGCAYLHYLLSFDTNHLIMGFSGGFQIEKTSSIFPFQYELMIIPAQFDVHYRFSIVPEFFYVEAGVNLGAAINLIDYKNETMDDLVIVKPTGTAYAAVGLNFGFAGIFIYDSFTIILFDTNMYLANSAGMGIELRF